eukprot:gi/632987846/ref/XP_007882782.1/ PREDICTED: NACHT, LRR and PYD domains-containing protein 3-like [Callorhinchus milii]
MNISKTEAHVSTYQLRPWQHQYQRMHIPPHQASQEPRQEENILGDDGLKRLSEALTNPKFKIQVLELQDHNLGDCGVNQLCDDLRKLECKIPTLWLRDIDLTTDSTEDVSSDLKINHKLTDLNLSHNKLGDRGVKRLCEALRNPECKIQSLRLGGNNLVDWGVKRLCEALKNPQYKIQRLW